jgi:CheY-like chemotaxis protein
MPKLLVVDDNAINLTLFRHLLQKLEGAEVECIDDPVAALDWCAAQRSRPDPARLHDAGGQWTANSSSACG